MPTWYIVGCAIHLPLFFWGWSQSDDPSVSGLLAYLGMGAFGTWVLFG